MMAPEYRESMQKGLEASLGGFQAKNLFYGPSMSFSGPTVDLKYNNGVKLVNCQSDGDGAVSRDKLAVPSEGCGRQVPQQSYYVLSALQPNFVKDVRSQSHPSDGYFYPANHGQYIQAQWIPRIPLQMAPLQDFQYFVVIDFEATCEKDQIPHPQEIIEFPSVLVNSRTGQLEGCFQKYVRPTHNKMLTDFCKELTGIQQSQVDKGVVLNEALLMHDKWLEDKGIKHTNFAVVTWSSWDCKVVLESECRFKRIDKPAYFNRWINLKVPFSHIFGTTSCNLREAVELAGLTWEGRAHSGLDDAKNTARLVSHLMHRGLKLWITNQLQWESADHPFALNQQQQFPPPESNPTYQSPKWKPRFGTVAPYQPLQFVNPVNEPPMFCHCGATSVKHGPKNGFFFFGCGNWTATRGPVCSFSKWIPASNSPTPA